MEIVYCPVGVGTFHMESAQKVYEDSVKILEETNEEVIVPEGVLLTVDSEKEYLKDKNPELIIFQDVTFANGDYSKTIIEMFPAVPVLLWCVKEPVIDGTRLRLNSLTGAFSAGFNFKHHNQYFEYVYGNPDEVKDKINSFIKAVRLKKELNSLNLAVVGTTPPGFDFGNAEDTELKEIFGINQLHIPVKEMIKKAESYSEEEGLVYLDKAKERMNNLDKQPYNNQIDFAKLWKAYDEYVKENNVSALASRCWPDYFVDYGTPVCAVLSMLNDDGIAASCETDAYGAVSMLLGMKLSDKAVFFGDPVSLDNKENTLTFWHCGTAACSLAKDNKAEVGVHCNRKIGPTLEFGCKESGKATLFRVGKDLDGNLRFLIVSGSIPDKPQQFYGTSVVFKPYYDAELLVDELVNKGYEPHYVLIYKDTEDSLKYLGNLLNIKTDIY